MWIVDQCFNRDNHKIDWYDCSDFSCLWHAHNDQWLHLMLPMTSHNGHGHKCCNMVVAF